MGRAGIVLLCFLIAAPAFAQSAYVVGSIGGELTRWSKTESLGFESPSVDGEVFGGSLRVGTSLGDRWGVELEFAGAAALEDETTQGPRILPAFTSLTFTSTTGAVTPGSAPTIAPIALRYSLRVRQRNPTVSTTAWIRQRAGSRVDLVYVGGVAFTRSTSDQESSFSVLSLPQVYVPSSQLIRTTLYNVGPVVGMEARIGLTEHVRLVPSVRLHGLSGQPGNGWLVRTGVGLGWVF